MNINKDEKIATLTNADTTSTFKNNQATDGDVILIQGDVQSGTPSWMVQGRVSPKAGWVDLLDSAETTSKIVAVVACREMRINQTGTGTTDFYRQ